jgi:hypothetical protein
VILGPAWTAPRPHKANPGDAASELRIRIAAGLNCLALAKGAPPSLGKALNLMLARRHAEAVLKMLPPEIVADMFGKDAQE